MTWKNLISTGVSRVTIWNQHCYQYNFGFPGRLYTHRSVSSCIHRSTFDLNRYYDILHRLKPKYRVAALKRHGKSDKFYSDERGGWVGCSSGGDGGVCRVNRWTRHSRRSQPLRVSSFRRKVFGAPASKGGFENCRKTHKQRWSYIIYYTKYL